MSSQVFYRKWRPQTLAEVVGQEHVTQTLLNALTGERISHAYLFCGPRGTGKTSTGRILAKALNCLNNGKGEPCNSCPICLSITEGSAMDVIEVDAASNTGVDDIRSLREKVNYAPNQARYKVYIIDEVHMLSTSASNALLKTLEEPPPHVIFILATTETHKILPTILSRCQRFDFHRLSQADVVNKLAHICESEGIGIENEALKLISRSSTGSLRDAENLLQQLNTYYGNDIKLKQVQQLLGISGDWRAKELVKHIVENNVPAGISTINSVNSDGLDLRQFNRELVDYLRVLLLVKTGSGGDSDLSAEDIDELKELASGVSLQQILKAVKAFGQLELGLDNYSTLPLELAMIDCALAAGEETEKPARNAKLKEPVKSTDYNTTPPPAKPAPTEMKPSGTTGPAPAVAKTGENPGKEAASIPEVEKEPEPLAAEESNTTPLDDGSPIEQLRINWIDIINKAPGGLGRTPAAALLRSGATPKDIQGDTLVISFKYHVHKENMEKIENQKTAEKIVSGFLGRSCQVRCVYEPDNNHLVKAAIRMGAQIIDTEGT